MKKLMSGAMAVAALALTASPAAAEAGKLQVKVLGTAVLPDGKITKVLVDKLGPADTAGVPAGTQTEANDNVVPTLAVEYFVTPNISVETICCLTQHDVDASAGPLKGAELVANAKILPATVTAKYHMELAPGIKPYIGAGPTYFIFINEKSGAATKAAFALPKMHLNDKVGVVAQGGIDIALGKDSPYSLTLDAKKYWLKTTATWYDASGAAQLSTRHKLDPWVLSAGVAYRF